MAKTLKTFSDEQLRDFLSKHRLPPEFRDTAERYFLPLARRLPDYRGDKKTLYLGINGAQGTGKSTLADFLSVAAKSMLGWTVAVLSIDDFYYTRQEREKLAAEVHPLLMVRGVPGTHDTEMLRRCIEQLRAADSGDEVPLPRFDKSIDDRADAATWPIVRGPVDLIILEGWCVGTRTQETAELEQASNQLERDEDPDGTWRDYVNDQLERRYARIFDDLDKLIFMQAPGFDAILRWRLEQEEKLAATSSQAASALMNEEQVTRFIQFFERLTRANLATLPATADIVFRLDEAHAVASSRES
jgi:D-glycerate 3-kinase